MITGAHAILYSKHPDADRRPPIVIQSLFMRIHGAGPGEMEVMGY